MRSYALPSREACRRLIRECHVPVHIVKHNEATARLGVFLAERLNETGAAVDVALVERACLLHDLFRVCDCPLEDFTRFEQPVGEEDKARWRRLKDRHGHRRHEDAAHAFLSESYPVLAETIRKHRYTAIVHDQDKPQTWAEKLVYYADKRVMHDTIVPLRDRLEEAHRRNTLRRQEQGSGGIDIAQTDAAIFALEEEIFGPLELDPDQVTGQFIDRYASEE